MDVNGGGKTDMFGYVVPREGYKGGESEGDFNSLCKGAPGELIPSSSTSSCSTPTKLCCRNTKSSAGVGTSS